MVFDIDFVVLWVDGNDPEWIAEKNRYLGDEAKTASSDNRFRDWGLMKYWFRAVEKYAPWVRKVHFVTWGHLPEFLNPDAEKLHIVNHRDYIPKDVLPTFNSEAIEMNLHRIPDLAEHFVYFNDDMFIARPMHPGDFFDPDTGDPKLHFLEMPTRFKGPLRPWERSKATAVGIANKYYPKKDVPIILYPGKFISTRYPVKDNIRNLIAKLVYPDYYIGMKIKHGMAPMTKMAYRELWEKEQALLQRTTEHKFRTEGDINQWSIMMMQMASGRFSPAKDRSEYFDASPDNIDRICHLIEQKTADCICINDPDWEQDWETLAHKAAEAFEKVLPDKSSFER